jgi:hypothetical protein
MAVVSGSVDIAVAPEKAYDYIAAPEKATSFIPGLNRISNVPRRYQFKTETGNRSTWTYSFDPQGNGTRVTLEVEYDVPQSMLARYASEGTLAKMNEDRGREALANLKSLLE